jgi:copper homeostasis protein
LTFVIMKPILEIIATNLDHVQKAQQSGADRIELCAALSADGLTPSHGFIKNAIHLSTLPIMVMIRPREGDFQYSEIEIESMNQDIEWAKKCGAMGIVIGILDEHQNVRTDVLKRWVQAAYPMEVTFHRAFDVAKDPMEALESIIDSGCTRILTSGQQKTCIEGKSLIKALQDKAGDRIIIMAGAGINGHSIDDIMDPMIREYHMSGHQTRGAVNAQEKMFGTFAQLHLEDIQKVTTALSRLILTEGE